MKRIGVLILVWVSVNTLLAQEGKLDLDDEVRKYLPEFPVYGDTITIRHLVHHTSGIRDYLGIMWLAGCNPNRISYSIADLFFAGAFEKPSVPFLRSDQ